MMRRLASNFFGGMILTVLPVNAISVYLFHDVDPDRVGQLNRAFAELCLEFIGFILVVGGLFMFFTWIGRALLHLQAIPPHPKLGLILGVLAVLLQYPFELAGRLFFPGMQDIVLTVYLLLSPMLFAALLLRDNFTKLARTAEGGV
jgi:hypothetical protein